MDDETFELLKRIDEGFEQGSGPYSKYKHQGRERSLAYIGNEGFNLRMAVMKAVEAEKASRAATLDSRREVERSVASRTESDPPPADLVAALRASLAAQGKRL